MDEAYFLFSTYILLVFDSVLYMLLALYFDKILPGTNDFFLFTRIDGIYQGNDGLLHFWSQPKLVWTERNLLCH